MATLLALLMLAPACAARRPLPVVIPPPAVAPPEPAKPATSPVSWLGYATARSALSLHLEWPAVALLEEVAARARLDGDRSLAARASYLAAAVTLSSGPAGETRARSLFAAARHADPEGPLAAASSIALDMMSALERQQVELQQLRDQLAGSDRERRRALEAADALKAEVAALRKQLDELKQVQLQIESEKKGGSP